MILQAIWRYLALKSLRGTLGINSSHFEIFMEYELSAMNILDTFDWEIHIYPDVTLYLQWGYNDVFLAELFPFSHTITAQSSYEENLMNEEPGISLNEVGVRYMRYMHQVLEDISQKLQEWA